MKQLIKRDTITSREIARLTGKPHYDLMKSIRKMEQSWVNLGQGNFSLSSYINVQNRAMPMYNLTKEECLYVATKFNDEARAKLILRWRHLEESQQPKTPAEQLLHNAQLLFAQEQKLQEHDGRIKQLEAKMTTRSETFTIAGYASLHNIDMPLKLASSLGRRAARLCKNQGITPDELPDPRFGKVKSYPQGVLESVFDVSIV